MGKHAIEAFGGFGIAEPRVNRPLVEKSYIESSGADKAESRTLHVEAETMEQELQLMKLSHCVGGVEIMFEMEKALEYEIRA